MDDKKDCGVPQVEDKSNEDKVIEIKSNERKPKKLIYWEGENLIVFDDRKNVKYKLEELTKRQADKCKSLATPLLPDGTKAVMPNMDLYINKLIAGSSVNPKLTDTDVENLKGQAPTLLTRAVMRMYGLDQELIEDF